MEEGGGGGLIPKGICDRAEMGCKGVPVWEREVVWGKEQVIQML